MPVAPNQEALPLQETKTEPASKTKTAEKEEENNDDWSPKEVVQKKEMDDDDRSRTQQCKLRSLQLNNKSPSVSPKVNKSQNNSESRRRPRRESIAMAPPDKQHGEVSNIEFEAKQNESSFSSDSDFDRNMDEMQSDAINEQ